MVQFQAILGQIPMGGLGVPPQLTQSMTISELAIFRIAFPTHLSECSLATPLRIPAHFRQCSIARHRI